MVLSQRIETCFTLFLISFQAFDKTWAYEKNWTKKSNLTMLIKYARNRNSLKDQIALKSYVYSKNNSM